MEEEIKEPEENEMITIEEILDSLTYHFRRTSRGRIVELPRWAQ